MVTLNEESLKKWQDGGLEYLRYQYPLDENSVVVDFGAYRGEWSDKIFDEYGCRDILLFDPTDNIHAAKNGRKIQACAWIENTQVRTNGAFYYTSQLHDNEIGLHKYEAVDIESHFPPKVDLLKVNIEGAEYYLLPYMLSKNLLQKVKYIQIQFHVTDKLDYQAIYKTIFQELKKTHTQEWNCPFVWESWRIK